MPRPRSKISPKLADGSPHHTSTLLVQFIPETTKRAFKMECARQGRPIRDVIIEFMRKFAMQPQISKNHLMRRLTGKNNEQ